MVRGDPLRVGLVLGVTNGHFAAYPELATPEVATVVPTDPGRDA